MSGPGPKDPPFFQHVEDVGLKALAAVEAAIAPVAQTVAQPVTSTIGETIAKLHTAEQAVLDATQKREVEAVDALEGFVANVRGHLDTLSARFPSLVSDFRAALSRL